MPSIVRGPQAAPSQELVSGILTVQSAVHEVVASFADEFTSVSVPAKPALARDVTAAKGHPHSSVDFSYVFSAHFMTQCSGY